jgi:hypothetical protein
MKKQSFISLTIIAGIILLLFACKPDQKQSSSKGTLPGVSGKPGEILVVMDTAKFNKTPGEAIKEKLQKAMRALPQAEPIFSLVNIPPYSFKDVFQRYRNVLIIDIDKKYSEPRFAVRKDVHAHPQTVLHAQASSYNELKNLFKVQGEKAAEKFLEAERTRYINTYKAISNKGAIKRIKEKFGIKMTIPKGYALEVDTTNFAWLEQDTRDYTQGILIYKRKYKEDISFTLNNLIKTRDRFTRKFVPGPSPNSFMIIETEITPYLDKKKINGNEVMIMRGLWKVKNDFMGGPFVNASVLSNDKKHVITVDGFVYAPKLSKRDYVRQLESIIHTLELNKK